MQTCKLVFPAGEVTREDVDKIVAENTEGTGVVHNFYPSKLIGCNRVAFSVVDIPNKFIANFTGNQHFKIEKMLNVVSPRGCDDGSCGSGCGCP